MHFLSLSFPFFLCSIAEYHSLMTLQAQVEAAHAGKKPSSKELEIFERYSAKHGTPREYAMLRLRQNLMRLEFESSSDRKDILNDILVSKGYYLNHTQQHEVVVAKKHENLPSVVASDKDLSPDAVFQKGLKEMKSEYANWQSAFTDVVLPRLMGNFSSLRDYTGTQLLANLPYAGYSPKIISLIANAYSERSRNHSYQYFGAWTIHKRLSLDQMDAFGKSVPDMWKDHTFVNTYLTKLQTSFGSSSTMSPSTRHRMLLATLAQAYQLPPPLAGVLHTGMREYLKFAIDYEAPDFALFFDWLRLERVANDADGVFPDDSILQRLYPKRYPREWSPVRPTAAGLIQPSTQTYASQSPVLQESLNRLDLISSTSMVLRSSYVHEDEVLVRRYLEKYLTHPDRAKLLTSFDDDVIDKVYAPFKDLMRRPYFTRTLAEVFLVHIFENEGWKGRKRVDVLDKQGGTITLASNTSTTSASSSAGDEAKTDLASMQILERLAANLGNIDPLLDLVIIRWRLPVPAVKGLKPVENESGKSLASRASLGKTVATSMLFANSGMADADSTSSSSSTSTSSKVISDDVNETNDVANSGDDDGFESPAYEFPVADPVKLDLRVKNVGDVTVRLYRVNTHAYYIDKRRPVDPTMSLEGIVPHEECVIKLQGFGRQSVVPLSLTFDSLAGMRGVFIIEALGNGQAARVVVRKGAITFVEQPTTVGHAFRLFDEERRPVSGSITCGPHTYHSDKKTGFILVPYTSTPNDRESIVLHVSAKNRRRSSSSCSSSSTSDNGANNDNDQDDDDDDDWAMIEKVGDTDASPPSSSSSSTSAAAMYTSESFSHLAYFNHLGETYSWNAALLVDPESLLSRTNTTVLIRAALYVNDVPINVDHVMNVKLTVTCVLADGTHSSKVMEGIKLRPDTDTAVSINVPENLRTLKLNLTASVRNRSTGKDDPLEESRTITVNKCEDSEGRWKDLYLRAVPNEGFVLMLLGRGGEGIPYRRLDVTFTHALLARKVEQGTMQTDERGFIALGPLDAIGVTSVTASLNEESLTRSWNLNEYTGPVACPTLDLHSSGEGPLRFGGCGIRLIEGSPLEIPYRGWGSALRSDHRAGSFPADVSICSLFRVSLESGYSGGLEQSVSAPNHLRSFDVSKWVTVDRDKSVLIVRGGLPRGQYALYISDLSDGYLKQAGAVNGRIYFTVIRGVEVIEGYWATGSSFVEVRKSDATPVRIASVTEDVQAIDKKRRSDAPKASPDASPSSSSSSSSTSTSTSSAVSSEVAERTNCFTIHIANATPTTRVHVASSFFLPTSSFRTALQSMSVTGLRASVEQRPRADLLEQRELGSEATYVIDRRAREAQRKRDGLPLLSGNMLTRPTLLLSKRMVRTTQTASDPVLRKEGAMKKLGRAGGGGDDDVELRQARLGGGGRGGKASKKKMMAKADYDGDEDYASSDAGDDAFDGDIMFCEDKEAYYPSSRSAPHRSVHRAVNRASSSPSYGPVIGAPSFEMLSVSASFVLLNGRVDANGIVSVPRSQIDGHHSILTVVAFDTATGQTDVFTHIFAPLKAPYILRGAAIAALRAASASSSSSTSTSTSTSTSSSSSSSSTSTALTVPEGGDSLSSSSSPTLADLVTLEKLVKLVKLGIPVAHAAFRECRLLPGLPPAKSYTEQYLTTCLSPAPPLGVPLQEDGKLPPLLGDGVTAASIGTGCPPLRTSITIEDAGSARLEAFSTLDEVWTLLSTLARKNKAHQRHLLQEFSFLPRWHSLSASAKADKYSKYSSHELNVFVFHHDRPFFEAVVRPFLVNKLRKTVIDLYLLGSSELLKYLTPHRRQRLNAFEQILVAAGVAELAHITAALVRDERACGRSSPVSRRRSLSGGASAAASRKDGITASGAATAAELPLPGSQTSAQGGRDYFNSPFRAGGKISIDGDVDEPVSPRFADEAATLARMMLDQLPLRDGLEFLSLFNEALQSRALANDSSLGPQKDRAAETAEAEAEAEKLDEAQMDIREEIHEDGFAEEEHIGDFEDGDDDGDFASAEDAMEKVKSQMSAALESIAMSCDSLEPIEAQSSNFRTSSAFSAKPMKMMARLSDAPSGLAVMPSSATMSTKEVAQAGFGLFASASAPKPAPITPLFVAPDTCKEYEERDYYDVTSSDSSAQQTSKLVPVNRFWAAFAAYKASSIAHAYGTAPAANAASLCSGYGRPFVTSEFLYATSSFTEVVFALSVMPLAPSQPQHVIKNTQMLGQSRLTLDARAPVIVFHREVRETPALSQPLVAVTQRYFDPLQRFSDGCSSSSSGSNSSSGGDGDAGANDQDENDGTLRDRFVSEFLPFRTYGCRVLISNASSVQRHVNVLVQIPQGSLPVCGPLADSGDVPMKPLKTQTIPLTVEPYKNAIVEYFFYFPAVGSYTHFPCHVSQTMRGGVRVIGAAAVPEPLRVVLHLTVKPSMLSWFYVSQQGSDKDVLAFLSSQPLENIDLSLVCWRFAGNNKNKDMFSAVTSILRERGKLSPTILAYVARYYEDVTAPHTSLIGGAVPSKNTDKYRAERLGITIKGVESHSSERECGRALTEFLEHVYGGGRALGPYFSSSVLVVDAMDAVTNQIQHLEYLPLINDRAHVLRTDDSYSADQETKRVPIRNLQLREQYNTFLQYLVFKYPSLDAIDVAPRLALVYYLLIQDRVEEARTLFQGIPRAAALLNPSASIDDNSGARASGRTEVSSSLFGFGGSSTSSGSGAAVINASPTSGTYDASGYNSRLPGGQFRPSTVAMQMEYFAVYFLLSPPAPSSSSSSSSSASTSVAASAEAESRDMLRALAIAQRYRTCQVKFWRELFAQVESYVLECGPIGSSRDKALDEAKSVLAKGKKQPTMSDAADGKVDDAAADAKDVEEVVEDAADRDKRMDAASLLAPMLTLGTITLPSTASSSGRVVEVTHQNVDCVELQYFEMDTELLFSSSPFLKSDASKFTLIAPNFVQRVRLNSKHGVSHIPLPVRYQSSNVVVRASSPSLGANSASTQIYFANSLNVQVVEAFGQVRVACKVAGSWRAMPGAYIKAYARYKDSSIVEFYKDGYTDLRGRFDYASLSTDKLGRVDRFSIFVTAPDHGSCIVEAGTPKQ